MHAWIGVKVRQGFMMQSMTLFLSLAFANEIASTKTICNVGEADLSDRNCTQGASSGMFVDIRTRKRTATHLQMTTCIARENAHACMAHMTIRRCAHMCLQRDASIVALARAAFATTLRSMRLHMCVSRSAVCIHIMVRESI